MPYYSTNGATYTPVYYTSTTTSSSYTYTYPSLQTVIYGKPKPSHKEIPPLKNDNLGSVIDELFPEKEE